jgi:hypothetical protein
MRSVTWPGSSATSERIAVLLPGIGYSVQRPLLYWCAEILVQQGWRVEAIEWTITEEDQAHAESVAEQALALAFAGVPENSERLIVAKSFGSHGLPWAVTAGVPGIWLTPVLTSAKIHDALVRAPASHLAIGGDLDELWAPAASLNPAATLVTVPGVDHSLETEGDWERSLEVQRDVFARVSAWIAALSS